MKKKVACLLVCIASLLTSCVCPFCSKSTPVTTYRGVMLPQRAINEDDLTTLESWGANLVRYQINRNWTVIDANMDMDDYDAWLSKECDIVQNLLDDAARYGIKVVVDIHTPVGGRIDEQKNMRLFFDQAYADHFVKNWEMIATRFNGHPSLYGYDLVNEPVQTKEPLIDYWELETRAAKAIRAIDAKTPIIVEVKNWDNPDAFEGLTPIEGVDNIIYQVHMYRPHTFTHQGVGEDHPKGIVYPGVIEGSYCDRTRLAEYLAPVREFQLKYNAKIYCGEFSAIIWGQGAEKYIADCISIFEEYGWDWSYHAFREWECWSVEHEMGPDGVKRVPSLDNPRKQALLKGFANRKK